MNLKRIRIPKHITEKPYLKDVKRVFAGTIEGTPYHVLYSETGKYIHIRVIRDDDKPICNYWHLQLIKNCLIGPNKTAIQVFPKAENMIDRGNTYHIWAWDGMKVPNLKELYDYST